jgi:hypothetical protein
LGDYCYAHLDRYADGLKEGTAVNPFPLWALKKVNNTR